MNKAHQRLTHINKCHPCCHDNPFSLASEDSPLTFCPMFGCVQVVGTGMLMLCILCLDEKRNTPAPTELIPPIVAVIVLGISMSMSANCGAAINPARDLGPRLFTLTAGWGTEVFT